MKPHGRDSNRYCIGGSLDALARSKAILGSHVTTTLLAKLEELNSENAKFDGDMRITTLHHTMDFKIDPGWNHITTDAQVLLLQTGWKNILPTSL